MPNTSRIGPCPCGSGRRYKDCCGRLADAVVAGEDTATTVARHMNSALAAQQSGDLRRAERIYRQVVAMAPDVPDALHMLGVLRFEQATARKPRS